VTAEPTSIDMKRLKYFIAVCHNGGFSRAASAIGIAQPALTRQIKLLEKQIGLPLVTRTRQGAAPTEEGKYLLVRAVEHVESLESMLREVKHKFSKLNGQVVLGICPTISPLFLDDLKAYLAASSPNLKLSVIEAYSGDLKNLMKSRRLDLALTYKPSKSTGIRYIELLSEKLVLVSCYRANAQRGSYSLADLVGLKLILPSRMHELRLIIDRILHRNGISLQPELELDSLDAVKALLTKRSKGYFTILSAHSVRHEVESKQFSQYEIAAPAPGMWRTIALVTPPKVRNEAIISHLRHRICERANVIKSTLEAVS
jgi:DNA-binding transcriptional LysR family regulator